MKEKELQVIKQAIINEIEGYEFYRMAAANHEDHSESKYAFESLSKEELKHVEYLKELFNKIKESDDDNFVLASIENPPSPGLYKWDRVQDKYTSMAISVFGIGIQMEKDSIEFYKKAKEETSYEDAKKLYDILIKWEMVHLDQFTKQYNEYKEEWWNSQGFSPF